MATQSNAKYLKLIIHELSPEDCDYDIIRKIASRLEVLDSSPTPADGITIHREGFSDISVGSYFIQEDGSGNTLGLSKKVDGALYPITFPLPGEIRMVKGSGIGPVTPPKGWKLVSDSEIQSKYNVGISPNWKVAAIEYIGI